MQPSSDAKAVAYAAIVADAAISDSMLSLPDAVAALFTASEKTRSLHRQLKVRQALPAMMICVSGTPSFQKQRELKAGDFLFCVR